MDSREGGQEESSSEAEDELEDGADGRGGLLVEDEGLLLERHGDPSQNTVATKWVALEWIPLLGDGDFISPLSPYGL